MCSIPKHLKANVLELKNNLPYQGSSRPDIRTSMIKSKWKGAPGVVLNSQYSRELFWRVGPFRKAESMCCLVHETESLIGN